MCCTGGACQSLIFASFIDFYAKAVIVITSFNLSLSHVVLDSVLAGSGRDSYFIIFSAFKGWGFRFSGCFRGLILHSFFYTS